MNRSRPLGRAILIALLVAGCSSNRGQEVSLKDGAKDAGHTIGTAAREVGQGAKKVGKAIRQAAKEGRSALKNAVNGEKK